jgi:hypothetical protein
MDLRSGGSGRWAAGGGDRRGTGAAVRARHGSHGNGRNASAGLPAARRRAGRALVGQLPRPAGTGRGQGAVPLRWGASVFHMSGALSGVAGGTLADRAGYPALFDVAAVLGVAGA